MIKPALVIRAAFALLACLPSVAVAQSAYSDTTEALLAVVVLETLPVKGRAPKTGYSREAFGPSWADTDYNGCDTRNDILRCQRRLNSDPDYALTAEVILTHPPVNQVV